MRTSRLATLVPMLAATIGHSAAAQSRNPQVAGIAPAPRPAEAQVSAPSRAYQSDQGSVPVFVANDGQIYADFGYGYERVIRNCAYAGAYSAPSHSAQTYALPAYKPPTYTPPTYTPPSYGQTTFTPRNTQPAPAQATQSERNLAAQTASASAQTPRPGATACWRADEQGRVIVVRP